MATPATHTEKDDIRAYAEGQLGEAVVHLEKVGSELVGPRRHDIWDVHCAEDAGGLSQIPPTVTTKKTSRAAM